MLTVYLNQGTCLASAGTIVKDADLGSAVWIDLFNPTEEEEQRVESLLEVDIPTRDEMREVESSSQLYHEDNATFITLRALSRERGQPPRVVAITMIIAREKFVTIRYADPTSFRNFVTRTTKPGANYLSALSALVCFAETLVDRDADLLEEAGDGLDKISAHVFAEDTSSMNKIGASDLNGVLKLIGQSGDIVARVRESLHSVARAVPFLQLENPEENVVVRLQTLQRDVHSLMDHATHLSEQVQFLLDSSVGLISIQQNAIMKALSVATIFFLPPTLIAGIYGMNFQHMPELATHYGYPFALTLMVLTAVVSYIYLRKRKML